MMKGIEEKLTSEIVLHRITKERQGLGGIGKAMFNGRIPSDLFEFCEATVKDLNRISADNKNTKIELDKLKDKMNSINQKLDGIENTRKEEYKELRDYIDDKISESEKMTLEKKKYWMMVIGIIVSIVFGVVSLILTFWKRY